MFLRHPNFTGLTETAREVVRLYDRERHRDHAYYFGGHDSRMCAQSFHAMGLWGLGFPDQGHRMAWRSVEDARDLGHSFSLAHALQRAGMTMLLLRDVESCRAVVDELYPLAERNNFAWQLKDAMFLRGWLAALDGDSAAGIEQMLRGTDHQFLANFRPVFMPQIAEAELRAGRFEHATATLERALVEAMSQENHFCEPEIYRLRGEVLLAQLPANRAAAELALRQAVALAVKQPCPPLQLRAASSLARLLAEDGRRTEARDLLAPVHGAFTEGFARPDWQAAKALLAELS
jgi:predicted ATPase